MSLLQRFSPSRRRYRRVWNDPVRKRAALELFARTEAEGARDVAAAVARTKDPWLRTHVERHAQDEGRHAEMFRRRAAELAESDPSRAPSATQVDPAFDLEAGRDDLGAWFPARVGRRRAGRRGLSRNAAHRREARRVALRATPRSLARRSGDARGVRLDPARRGLPRGLHRPGAQALARGGPVARGEVRARRSQGQALARL